MGNVINRRRRSVRCAAAARAWWRAVEHFKATGDLLDTAEDDGPSENSENFPSSNHDLFVGEDLELPKRTVDTSAVTRALASARFAAARVIEVRPNSGLCETPLSQDTRVFSLSFRCS